MGGKKKGTKKADGQKKKRNSGKKLTRAQKLRQRLGDKKTIALFRALGDRNLPSRSRSGLIERMSKKELRAVREIILNFMHKNIPVQEADFERIRKYKNTLRKLVRKETSVDEQKQTLIQRGGIIPFLLPLLMKGIVGGAVSAIGAAGR